MKSKKLCFTEYSALAIELQDVASVAVTGMLNLMAINHNTLISVGHNHFCFFFNIMVRYYIEISSLHLKFYNILQLY